MRTSDDAEYLERLWLVKEVYPLHVFYPCRDIPRYAWGKRSVGQKK